LGADANRNFGYHFNEGGSSPEPCSDSFHGSGPFSEKETQNIRNFLLVGKNHISEYMTELLNTF